MDKVDPGPLATLLDRLAKAEGEYEAGLQHRNDMYDRIVSLRIDVGAATARAEATAAERDALQAQVARMTEALKPFLTFHCSFDGFGVEPADLMFGGIKLGSMSGITHEHIQRLLDVARAALKTQEDEHAQP